MMSGKYFRHVTNIVWKPTSRNIECTAHMACPITHPFAVKPQGYLLQSLTFPTVALFPDRDKSDTVLFLYCLTLQRRLYRQAVAGSHRGAQGTAPFGRYDTFIK